MFIITGLSTGGAETMLLKLLFGINRERFSPVVISLTDKGTIGPHIEALNIPLYSLGMWRNLPTPIALLRLACIVHKEKPQIIQGWMYHGNFVAQLSSLFAQCKTPIIWNIRGTHTNLKLEPILTALVIWLGARLSGLPTYIINNSRNSALAHQQWLGFRGDKWRIIPNGFDTTLFSPSESARKHIIAYLGLLDSDLVIGLMGRYHPMKDHAGFLHSAKITMRKYPNVHFLLVGSGVDKNNPTLMQIINDLKLNGNIHLLGEQSDMPSITATIDIACSSSLYGEGFSNAIGEAMSCAVPCVVTDVGDSAWIVGETGRVVPPGNPEAMANALSELIAMGADGRKSLGIMARQRAIDNFSIVSVVRQYEMLFEEVLIEKEKTS